MNKMIYVPDNLVDEIKEAAERQGKSFSAYLVGLHVGNVPKLVQPELKDAIGKHVEGSVFIPCSKESQLRKKK